MDRISKAITETEDNIKSLTKRTLETLVTKWETIFSEDLVESNICLLSDHVRTFFNEILSETDKKEETILKKIECLRKEQLQLQRLLKVEKHFELDHIPLLNYQVELDKNLVELREQVQSRKLQIQDLLLKQEALCNVLEEPRLKLYEDPLSSSEDLDIFKKNLTYLQTLKNERTKTVSELRVSVKKLSKELDIPILDEPCYSLLNNTQMVLSQYNVEQLTQLKTDLKQQKYELSEAIQNLKKKLQILWDCLEVDDGIRRKFNAYTGHSQATYDKLKQELNRCEVEKRQHIKVFVDRIRQEITTMWDLSLKSDEEREHFGAFTSECFNQDLLHLHELELQSLKDSYESNKKIFEYYAEHKKLFDRMLALETAENPDRLKNRGGKLLKEEQERKRIARDLPKIRQQIIELAADYEENSNKKFLVFGMDIVDVINALYDEREEKKQLIASTRKMNGTAIQRTPMSVNKSVFPHSSIKRIASATNVTSNPSKRMHLEVPDAKAKRGLFVDTNTKNPPPFAKPTPVVKPVKKKKTTIVKTVVATLINRRQSNRVKKRKSKNSSKSSSVHHTTAESSVVDYRDFQNHVSARKANRSSEVAPNQTPLMRKDIRPVRLLRPATPSQQTRTPSPRSGCNKLSTKNIPIIF